MMNRRGLSRFTDRWIGVLLHSLAQAGRRRGGGETNEGDVE